MRNKSLSNRYLTILFSILICIGMILSSCSKSDSDTETKKSKKTKKTEVSEVAEEETESETPKETAATTESETEPPDPERVRLAGTYEGYATQTKAESHPEKGSLNNYAILRNDGSFRLVLNEDGTGKWEDSMNGSYDISEWTATGDSVTITLPGRTVPGPGVYDYSYVDRALLFLLEKGITPKGHPLFFGHREVNPKWMFS